MQTPAQRRVREQLDTFRDGGKRPRRSGKAWGVGVTALLLLVATFAYSFVHRMFISPPVDATVERSDGLVHPGEHIQVNVLNATRVPGASRKVMEFLRARGFDVVEIGNLSDSTLKSEVIDRVGDSLASRRVARALGVADSSTRRDVDPSLFLSATVIVGRDYRVLRPWN